jgi:hypothetical protein
MAGGDHVWCGRGVVLSRGRSVEKRGLAGVGVRAPWLTRAAVASGVQREGVGRNGSGIGQWGTSW